MTDLSTLRARLHDAQEAYHALMTGQQEVSVNISGYGSITYTTTNINQLTRYIDNLNLLIARQSGHGGRKALIAEF